MMLHEKNGRRWVSTPGRAWRDARGEKRFADLIAFRDRASADRFRYAVLAAIDEYRQTAAAGGAA
jgi:hypothetical protein